MGNELNTKPKAEDDKQGSFPHEETSLDSNSEVDTKPAAKINPRHDETSVDSDSDVDKKPAAKINPRHD